MRFRPILTVLVLLAASTVVVAQGDPSKPKSKAKPKPEAEEEVLTFTTRDLERKYGASVKPKAKPPVPAAKPAPPTRPKGGPAKGAPAKGGPGKGAPQAEAAPAPPAKPDALALMQQKQADEKRRAQERASANQRIAAAKTRIAELEKRLAALRNPLLGRAQAGEADQEAWKKADQGARLRMTEEKLATAREELVQANAALKEIR